MPRGLVHRDLKAANVLLEEDEPGALHARIVDFGIAHLTTADAPDEHGALLGSPEYLAPELLDGGAATPASDLYAVGIILCEMVTGRTPFAADHSTVVLHRHLYESPARPPEMPVGLWHRVEPFLAKDPARRPATADAGRRLLAGSSPESGAVGDATIVPSAQAARRPPLRATRSAHAAGSARWRCSLSSPSR